VLWRIPLTLKPVTPINSSSACSAPVPEATGKFRFSTAAYPPSRRRIRRWRPLIERCVTEKKTLTATFTHDALSLADVLVVDVQCDFLKEDLGNLKTGFAEIGALEESFKIIGKKISPHCLVLIETTVPPGTTEYVAFPLIKKGFKARGIEADPLLAHSYERVMPGKNYVRSVRDFWRVCSGINPESREK
jgi:UDP-N-acetyl-D-glucosamine dehydrogenase